jgi:DNA helicase-4
LAGRLAVHGLDLAPRAIRALVARPAAAARLNDTAALLATCITLHTGAVTRDSGRLVRSERSDQSLAIDQDGQGSTPVGQESASAPAPAKGNSDSRDVRRQQAFDALFRHVLQSYEAYLATRGEIDFNDMIAGAAERLDAARGDAALRQRVAPLIPFRYLLVDEFQDISAGRAGLVKALRRARPGMRLLAVGDDWQSIYRFAGSDVSIMTGFEGHFGHTETRFLRQTFRFDQRLESVASAFVLRNPAQIRKQVEARQATSDAPSVVLWLPGEDTADDPMPAIAVDLFGPPLADPLSIGIATQGVSAASCPASVPATPTPATPAPAFPAQAPPDILILGRYRALEAQARLDWLAAHYPQARWRYSTIHRAKGATADYAVVLGVRSGRQPFPVERPDDPLLAGFLGVVEAFPHAEERRLFYVALTRARHRVYVVGDRRQPSPFFEELLAQGGDVSLRPSDPASASSPA